MIDNDTPIYYATLAWLTRRRAEDIPAWPTVDPDADAPTLSIFRVPDEWFEVWPEVDHKDGSAHSLFRSTMVGGRQ